MSSFVKTTLLLLLALGVGAALLAVRKAPTFYQPFMYCLLYSLFYGWAFYLPFVAAYAALSRRWSLGAWLVPVLGAGLAVAVSAPIWASPTFPVFSFSGSRLQDASSWAGAGAVYGLVHQRWIRRKPKRLRA